MQRTESRAPNAKNPVLDTRGSSVRWRNVRSGRPAATPRTPTLLLVEPRRELGVQVGIEHVGPRVSGDRLERVAVHGVDLEQAPVATTAADSRRVEVRLALGHSH